MSIRSSAKAIMIREGMILLNRCRWSNGDEYYDLPGGGQWIYEAMEDAVVREVYEETGYRIRPTGLAAVAEEIYEGEALRVREPEYTHRISHIFLAEIMNAEPDCTWEYDDQQEACVWMPLESVPELPMVPSSLKRGIGASLAAGHPLFLGTERISPPEN